MAWSPILQRTTSLTVSQELLIKPSTLKAKLASAKELFSTKLAKKHWWKDAQKELKLVEDQMIMLKLYSIDWKFSTNSLCQLCSFMNNLGKWEELTLRRASKKFTMPLSKLYCQKSFRSLVQGVQVKLSLEHNWRNEPTWSSLIFLISWELMEKMTQMMKQRHKL